MNRMTNARASDPGCSCSFFKNLNPNRKLHYEKSPITNLPNDNNANPRRGRAFLRPGRREAR
jgi:hypothetical protein